MCWILESWPLYSVDTPLLGLVDSTPSNQTLHTLAELCYFSWHFALHSAQNPTSGKAEKVILKNKTCCSEELRAMNKN